MRVCTRCKVELTPNNTTPGVFKTRNNRCKKCWSLQNREHRESHPKAAILQRIKGNARTRGLECSLTVSDIPDIPKYCPVFPWIILVYRVGVECGADSPSLDRIDNTKGYVRGNIRWISHRANLLKSDASGKELIFLGRDAKKWAASF